MKRNRIIIIALAVFTVLFLLSAVSAWTLFDKKDTVVKFKSKSPLTEGKYLKVRLTDADGNPLSNKTVNITITDKNGNEKNRSVITNDNGIGKMKVKVTPGKYNISASFEGDDEYNANATNKTFKVKAEVIEAQMETTSSNSDPGAFYSEQAGRTIYTGEIQNGPDGHTWKHLGYNEWVKID